MFLSKLVLGIGVIFYFLFLPSRQAYAYLDPGSGSLILQILFAALLAIPLSAKRVLKKIKSLFKRKSRNSKKPGK